VLQYGYNEKVKLWQALKINTNRLQANNGKTNAGIFLLSCILPFVIFIVYINKQSANITERNLLASLSEIAREKAEVIALNLREVERDTEFVTVAITNAYSRGGSHSLTSNYYRDRRGVLSLQIESKDILRKSNVFFPSNKELTPKIINQIIQTEELDTIFAFIKKKNPEIVWIYFTTEDGMMRIFPHASNDAYPQNHDQRNDPFFTVANPLENPGRKTVWTKPYNDFLGKGWMVTCSSPVYDSGGVFRGVVCTDILLETLKNYLSDFRIGQSGYMFLVEDGGDIIYHPDFIPVAQSQGQFFPYNYLELDLAEDYEKIIRQMMTRETGESEYISPDSGKRHIVSFHPVKGASWSVGIDVPIDEYFVDRQTSAGNFILFGIIVFCSMWIVGGYFFMRFSSPILQLSKDAERIAAGDYIHTQMHSSCKEIRALGEAFNAMNDQIKEKTNSLLHSKQQLETVFNSIGGSLMIVDREYRVKMVNALGEKNASRSNGEIIGAPCYSLWTQNKTPCEECVLQTAFTTGRPSRQEIVIDQKIFSNWYYPIQDENSEISEVVVYSRNVTKEMAIEREIAQKEKMAMVGQLSAGIAHELKNPLAVIKGAIYLLKRYLGGARHTAGQSQHDYQEIITEVDSNLNRAEKIIYNLLDFSKKSLKTNEPIKTKNLIDQILMLVSEELTHKRIAVEVDVSEEASVFKSRLDLIKNTFLNLISNAVQALDLDGVLRISAQVQNTKLEKMIVFTFEDNGYGIPSDIQEKIFDPFFTTKEGCGVGLGLWLTNREISLLGGEIQVSSSPGNGTRFTVILPLQH
jgi:signal transduction histidine kinase/HAMP domain-containing protein